MTHSEARHGFDEIDRVRCEIRWRMDPRDPSRATGVGPRLGVMTSVRIAYGVARHRLSPAVFGGELRLGESTRRSADRLDPDGPRPGGTA